MKKKSRGKMFIAKIRKRETSDLFKDENSDIEKFSIKNQRHTSVP